MRVAFWSDGNQMTFHNWAAQDPNRNLECVFMNGTNGKWYLDGCDKKMTYICIRTGKSKTETGLCAIIFIKELLSVP